MKASITLTLGTSCAMPCSAVLSCDQPPYTFCLLCCVAFLNSSLQFSGYLTLLGLLVTPQSWSLCFMAPAFWKLSLPRAAPSLFWYVTASHCSQRTYSPTLSSYIPVYLWSFHARPCGGSCWSIELCIGSLGHGSCYDCQVSSPRLSWDFWHLVFSAKNLPSLCPVGQLVYSPIHAPSSRIQLNLSPLDKRPCKDSILFFSRLPLWGTWWICFASPLVHKRPGLLSQA